MFRGIYSAATGMQAAARSQEVTAHNVAHGTVPGYRQHGVVHESFDQALGGASQDDPTLIGARVAQQYSDFRPGPLQETGTQLDLAVQGDGFFTVRGPQGPLYSRDGVLQRATDGQLVNTGGYPILGARGPIRIPAQATNVVVALDGSVMADGVPVDQLQLARFKDAAKLQPVGTTLFRAPDEAGREPARAGVVQGYREGSNVPFASAMVTMVRDLRHFEASQRALRTISDSVGQITRASA